MFRSISRLSYLCLALLVALAALVGTITSLGRVQPVAARPLATFIVSNTLESGVGSLRQAILDANASPGADVVDVTAAGTVNLLSALPTISEAVTIQGPGANLFRVDGQDVYRVFDIGTVPVTMTDLTVQRGNVTGVSANGAGIRSGGNLVLTRVEILSNTAQSHGGGVQVTGDLTLTDSLFQNNHSTNGIAGGLRSSGTTNISGTNFVGNSSQGDGGAAFLLGQIIVISDGLFQENHCHSGSCDGGGLFSFSHTTLNNTQFLSNTAQDAGGGASAPGVLILTNGSFQNNQSVFGSGGGLYAQDIATIQGTQFLSNTARSRGGGLYMLGAVTVTAAVFDGNQSTIATGGGLHAFGMANVSATQFRRNVAVEGGGLYHGFEDGRVINSLFAGNQATNDTGAAILLASTGTVAVVHVTIAGESVAGGPAIEVLTGTVGITNTILTSHTIGINNSGAIVTQDYNLFFGNGTDAQGAIAGGANSVTGNPRFIDPPHGDYHLGQGSAAIDAGSNAAIMTDFDGDGRPFGPGFDIGFDEANFTADVQPYHLYLPLVMR